MSVYNLLKRLNESFYSDLEAEQQLNKLGIYLNSEQKLDLLRSSVEDFMKRHNMTEVKAETEAEVEEKEETRKIAKEEGGRSLRDMFGSMDIETVLVDFHEYLKKNKYETLIYCPLRPRSIYEGEVLREVKIEDLTFLFIQHKIKRSYSYGLVEKGLRTKVNEMALNTWLHTYNRLSREFIKDKYNDVKIDINTFLRHLLAMVYINANRNIMDYALILNNADYFILSHTPKSNLKFYISNAQLVLQEQTKLVYEIRRIIKQKHVGSV